MTGGPRVHVTGPVPARITAELERDFALADDPVGADGVLSLIDTRIDGAYLDRAGERLKVVANYGVGFDNIDLGATAKRRIVVTNTPDVLTRTTAELTVALVLALLRRVAEGDRLLRRGRPWQFALEFMLGESLDGKVVGIVGSGRIGRETGRLVEAFGAKVISVGRNGSLDELLAAADVVSLHCPLTAETRHLIGTEAFDRMRPTAVLVNTARGAIVDEAALVHALGTRAIAGAALDVFEFEPAVAEELLTMENVVLTPHLGSATRQTREAMGMLAVEALRSVLLRGEIPANAVALPGSG